MHNSGPTYSLIMEDPKFSEFVIDCMWAVTFLQQVYSVRYHISAVLRSAKRVIVIEK